MDQSKTYLLIIDQEAEIPFYKLLNLCKAIKAEKKYQVIHRALKNGKTYSFNGYIIKATGKPQYQIDGKTFDNIRKSKRTKS